MLRLLLFLLALLPTMPVHAQQLLKPSGRFGVDTVRLGEPLTYTLVHRHPAAQEVILPDSGYTFAPFEFVRKDFYPTITRGGISTDSVIYTLRTFETPAVQQLALPVFVLQGKDTVAVYAQPDAVVLRQLVQQVTEPLQLQAETTLAPVEERFNWPVLLLWLVAGTVFLSLIWFIFGQAIRTKYKLYRLRKDHVYFASRYSSHADRFIKTAASGSIEKAVSLWKNYLTKLERSAINSFTTKEIVEFYLDDEEVNTALRILDKAIYGNLQSESEGEANLALGMLRRFAKSRYKIRRELIKDARYNR
ncbi:hypothetical protein [Pontibacter liquoris]|uniref:hypothetical protein n=1 Tax=Pontibacter liquoris TaxID=2905677 RepID=UPI001FA7E169|nr:hypothetical protein [Pontibacter liquoris]